MDGISGGSNAVNYLKRALQEYLKTVDDSLAVLPVMVRTFANLEGLSNAMAKSGMGKVAKQLPLFAQGFSQTAGLCDFVFVGRGKDRADQKIKGELYLSEMPVVLNSFVADMLKQFMGNPTCKHIVLGACHDNSYVRELETIAPDISMQRRLTLLKSFETGHEFSSLPFPTTRVESLFRESRLPQPSVQASASSPTLPEQRVNTASGFNGSYVSKASGGTSTVISAQQPVTGGLAVASRIVLVNPLGHRVDRPLQQPTRAGIEYYNQRTKMDNIKFCNNHQLRQECYDRSEHGYSHENLTPDVLLVLRHRLRTKVCNTGLGCRDPLCFYGHNCKCSKTSCEFSNEMHNVSLASVKGVRV
jgi:hypothetical protein